MHNITDRMTFGIMQIPSENRGRKRGVIIVLLSDTFRGKSSTFKSDTLHAVYLVAEAEGGTNFGNLPVLLCFQK